MSKKIKIYLICISLMSFAYLFLYPLPHLFAYNPLSLLTGLQNKITLSEPVIMFFLGAGLIGVAGFARRRFRSKTSS